MGNNFYTKWIDKPTGGYTVFNVASMDPALAGLDRGITYAKNVIVSCDGAITYVKSTGVLTWADVIRIHFNRADGQAILNTIAAGNITLADNEFFYVTLSETNNAVLTASKAAITTGVASNFLAVGILVFGYRNAVSHEFYSLYLTVLNPTIIELILSGLTASQAVMTDGSKKLVSVDYLDQPVKQASSPTFQHAHLTDVIADNLATNQGATTAFAKFEDAVLKRKPDQAVNMTAAASGSNGIMVADNDNIDFGTGNFALVWKGSLPDWTPATNVILMQKLTGGVGYQLEIVATTGLLRLTLNATAYNSSVAPTITDGMQAEIKVMVTVGAVNTLVDFYFNGVALGSQQTAANSGTVSSAAILYILGTSAVRTAGVCQFAATFNRALSATDILDLYRNGINYADKWGSQTELMPNQVDRDFSGASAWANVDLNSYDETADLSITANAADQYCTCPVASMPTTIGYKYRLKFDVANIVSTWIIKSFDGTQTIGTISANGTQQAFEWIATTTGGLRIVAVASDSSGDFDNFTLTKLGATLALEPEGINPDKWYDSSLNILNATYPTVGSSLIRSVGTFSRVVRTETTTYAVLTTDSVIVCNGSFTITLPTPVGASGKIYTIKSISTAGIVTLATAAGLIDGVATFELDQYDSVTVISDGTNWLII